GSPRHDETVRRARVLGAERREREPELIDPERHAAALSPSQREPKPSTSGSSRTKVRPRCSEVSRVVRGGQQSAGSRGAAAATRAPPPPPIRGRKSLRSYGRSPGPRLAEGRRRDCTGDRRAGRDGRALPADQLSEGVPRAM